MPRDLIFGRTCFSSMPTLLLALSGLAESALGHSDACPVASRGAQSSQADWAVHNNTNMRYQIEVTQFEADSTAVIRSRVPAKELPRFVPAACGEVWSFIRSAGLPRPGRHMALYLDAQGSVEVGAEVSEPFAGNERIHCSQLPAGRVVTTVHFGPYATPFGSACSHSRVVRRARAPVFRCFLGDLRSLGGELEYRCIKDTHRCFLSASRSKELTRRRSKPAAINRKDNYETINIGSDGVSVGVIGGSDAVFAAATDSAGFSNRTDG